MATKNIKNADGKGWLIVKYSSDGSTYPALPQYLRVNYLKTVNDRDYFTVLEGRAKDREASVVKGYLADGDPTGGAGTIKFDPKAEKLWYGGLGPVRAITSSTKPVPAGTHDIELPDEPHDKGIPYESKSIYAKTWFRIGHTGDRYLHTGAGSDGCITVTEIEKWTDIYNYLIKRRKGDGLSVGTVEVVQAREERRERDAVVVRLGPKLSEEQLQFARNNNPDFSIEWDEGSSLFIAKRFMPESALVHTGSIVSQLIAGGDLELHWRFAPEWDRASRLRLTELPRQAGQALEAGEIDLARYAGEIIKVEGDYNGSDWICSARILEHQLRQDEAEEAAQSDDESVYDRLWAIKSGVEDMLDEQSPNRDVQDDLSTPESFAPLNAPKLALVVGHTLNSPGAYGVAPIGTYEYPWNKDLANIIKSRAVEKGIECAIFFRDNGGLKGAYSRVEAWGAQASIELHFNNAEKPQTAVGTEVLYGKYVPSSKTLAAIMQKKLVALYNRTSKADRKIKLTQPGQRGYNNTHTTKIIPNCLTEPFFGDHKADAALGQTLKNKQAESLIDGFLEFIKG
jgi:N-acetylmuramoyl-L-alanine amidase